MPSNYFGVRGAAENTFGLCTRADATVLHDRLMNGFEWLSADPGAASGCQITVAGGVELAGTTLSELRKDVLHSVVPTYSCSLK